MWLDPKQQSWWAYNQCKNGNNIEDIRRLININFHAYRYCKDIKDRPEIRKYIIEK